MVPPKSFALKLLWPARVQASPGADISPGSKEWLHHVQEQATGSLALFPAVL